MRPTLTELLGTMRRTLEEVVAPEVDAPYAAQMLRGVVANLEVIEASWDRVLPFFAWDNEQMLALLEQVAGELGEQPPALAADGERPFDAAYARNVELRGLLAEAIPRLDPGGEAAAAARTHLAERAERYPLAWRWVA
jgi:hypothetical protein